MELPKNGEPYCKPTELLKKKYFYFVRYKPLISRLSVHEQIISRATGSNV